MTVGTEMCSWVDAEDWRTNEGIKTEQAGYVGAQINTPRHAKDSQGTERPLRVLLLLFPQGKRRPRRRRGGKGKRRREPPPPRRGCMKHPSTKKEEKRRRGPPGCRFKWGRPQGRRRNCFPHYTTPPIPHQFAKIAKKPQENFTIPEKKKNFRKWCEHNIYRGEKTWYIKCCMSTLLCIHTIAVSNIQEEQKNYG